MSWSEIKKAVNSNLDLPLNEKLEKMFLYDNFVARKFIFNQSALKTLVDVSGKGELQYFELYSQTTCATRITIDDNVYYFNATGYVRDIASQKYFRNFGGTVFGMPTTTTRNISVSSVERHFATMPFHDIQWGSDSPSTLNEADTVFVAFKNELKFNKKLKIEASAANNSNAAVGIGYELYD